MTCGDYVIDKTAPQGGRVRVALEGRQAFFHKVPLDGQRDAHFKIITGSPVPDAVIGLNAGIGAYGADWMDMIPTLILMQIPFSFSEYTRHSHRSARDFVIPRWIEMYNSIVQSHLSLGQDIAIELRLNPFHGIVSRDLAVVLLPNVDNGYLLTWKGPLSELGQGKQE